MQTQKSSIYLLKHKGGSSSPIKRLTTRSSPIFLNSVASHINSQPQVLKPEIRNEKSKGYFLTSREYKPDNTTFKVKDVLIGGDSLVVIAGPCAVESFDQIMEIAQEVKQQGASILRGGCFKPRTSPYSFQGLGVEGLKYLAEAGQKFEMPVITEVVSPEDVPLVSEYTDILQIGARNMQNYVLLQAVGKGERPVMLKRGVSASLDELLQAAEYILAQGNQKVLLCERGIRTFETATRYTLDISAIPLLQQLSHLPIFVDPSHACGIRELVLPLSLAAKAVRAHGIMLEIHPYPENALSDGPQSLYFEQFETLMLKLLKD